MLETNLDIRRDVAETRAIVSEVQRDVIELQQTLRSREKDDGQNLVVGNTSVLSPWMSSDCPVGSKRV